MADLVSTPDRQGTCWMLDAMADIGYPPVEPQRDPEEGAKSPPGTAYQNRFDDGEDCEEISGPPVSGLCRDYPGESEKQPINTIRKPLL